MKNALRYLAATIALTLAVASHAQTKSVLKGVSTNAITENLVFPSGKTLTIQAGATIDATGATVTGFGSGGTWGSITGTLSNQTDLNTALGLKAPLASPTFTGTVTIPSGASITGYATTAAVAAGYQPLDSDLTSIAALTTTTHGRSLLTGANAAASRLTLGLGPDDDFSTNNITAAGTIGAALFTGSGAGLTDLPVSTSLEPGLYLPAGWDAGWLAAVAAKDSTSAEIVCFGDSITTGAGAATSNHNNGFAGKLRDLLTANRTDLSHEYIPCTNFSYTDFNHGAIVEPWTSPTGLAGYTEQFDAGLHRTYYSSATSSVFQTFTVPYDCTDSWLWVMQWSSGSAGWRKNGGAWQTISAGSTALAMQRVNVGSLVTGDTIDIGNQSGGNLFRPLGIELQKAATGISFGKISAGSARLSNYSSGSTYSPGSGGVANPTWFHYVAGMEPLTGVWPAGDFTAAYTGGFPRRPHCAVITFGANDAFTGITAAVFRTNLSRLVAALRSGRSGCSIIIQMVHYPEQVVDEATSYMPAPAAPSVSVQGTPGATSTLVRIAYEGFYGVGLYSAATTVANAPATINGTDFLRITTSAAPTAARYIRVYTSTNGGSTWSYMQLSLASNPAYVDYTNASFSGTLPTEASALANSANWSEYIGAAMDVAQSYGCALVNWNALWAGKARAQGWMNDDIHPTSAGHLQMADKLYDLLN